MSIFTDLAVSRRPLAAFVVVGLGWGSFSALVPEVKAQIEASDGVYGALMLLVSVGALCAMWLAPLAFRVFGRWAIVIGSLCIGFGFAGGGGANSMAMFVAAMFLAAAGSGVADVLANAEISEAEARTDRPLMNLNHGLYSFAFAGGAVVAGTLRGNAWSAFEVLIGFAVVVVGLCVFMWSARPSEAPQEPDTGATAGTLPGALVWIGGGIVLSAFLAEAATEGWSALHLERTLGGAPGEGAWGPALFGLMMGIGRLFGHVVLSRFSDLWLMTLACFIAAVGLALAGIAPEMSLAYGGFALAGLGISVVVPLALGLVGRSVPDEFRLIAITRATALGYAAFFLGPPVMGAVAQVFGLRASFCLIAAMLVAVGVFAIPALARQVRANASPT